MKKTMFAILVALLGFVVFTGAASAKTPTTGTGLLHDYIVQAAADELGLPVADVDTSLESGITLSQFALDNGITEEDLPSFLKDVRTAAIEAALEDEVITDAQAEKLLKAVERGMGRGMAGCLMGCRYGLGTCGTTDAPLGTCLRYCSRLTPAIP